MNMREKQKTFTESDSNQTMQFEKDIAYFYGAQNSEAIAKHYLNAIKALEKSSLLAGNDRLNEAMLPFLKEAYAEVQKQTSLKFDIEKAAQYEFELILAQSKGEPFEKIYEIMKNLYGVVFYSDGIKIHKGAMLRTFLYKYKLSLLNQGISLSNDDRMLMISIAKASEKELNKMVKKERA